LTTATQLLLEDKTIQHGGKEMKQPQNQHECNLRALQSSDLFLLAKLVGKLNLQSLSEIDFNGNQQAVGFAMIGTVLENLEYCEKEVYDLLSKLGAGTVKEVKEMEADVFLDLVAEVVQSEGFSKLLGKVQSLLQKSGSVNA